MEIGKKRTNQARAISALFLLSVLYISETSLFPVLVVDLNSELSCQNTDPSAWGSTFGYGMAFGILASVLLKSKVGELKTVLAGVATMAASIAMLSLVSGCTLALGLRVLQGVGAGLFAPLVPVLLNSFDGDLRNSLLARWSAVTGLTAAFSPILATLLGQSIGSQSVLALLAALSFLVLFMLNSFDVEKIEAQDQYAEDCEFHQWVKLVLIFARVTVTFGFATWVLYTLLSVALEIDVGTDILAISVMLAWICSAGASLLISKLPALTYQSLLYLSVVVAGAASATLLWTVEASHLVVAGCLAGLGMGLANVPSTVCAFQITSRRLHGLVSAADILCARLGGAVFISLLG